MTSKIRLLPSQTNFFTLPLALGLMGFLWGSIGPMAGPRGAEKKAPTVSLSGEDADSQVGHFRGKPVTKDELIEIFRKVVTQSGGTQTPEQIITQLEALETDITLIKKVPAQERFREPFDKSKVKFESSPRNPQEKTQFQRKPTELDSPSWDLTQPLIEEAQAFSWSDFLSDHTADPNPGRPDDIFAGYENPLSLANKMGPPDYSRTLQKKAFSEMFFRSLNDQGGLSFENLIEDPQSFHLLPGDDFIDGLTSEGELVQKLMDSFFLAQSQIGPTAARETGTLLKAIQRLEQNRDQSLLMTDFWIRSLSEAPEILDWALDNGKGDRQISVLGDELDSRICQFLFAEYTGPAKLSYNPRYGDPIKKGSIRRGREGRSNGEPDDEDGITPAPLPEGVVSKPNIDPTQALIKYQQSSEFHTRLQQLKKAPLLIQSEYICQGEPLRDIHSLPVDQNLAGTYRPKKEAKKGDERPIESGTILVRKPRRTMEEGPPNSRPMGRLGHPNQYIYDKYVFFRDHKKIKYGGKLTLTWNRHCTECNMFNQAFNEIRGYRNKPGYLAKFRTYGPCRLDYKFSPVHRWNDLPPNAKAPINDALAREEVKKQCENNLKRPSSQEVEEGRVVD